jgi:hypothetical protein
VVIDSGNSGISSATMQWAGVFVIVTSVLPGLIFISNTQTYRFSSNRIDR